MEENNAAKASAPRAGRICTPEQRRRYYEQNIQRERQSSKAYRERNRERVDKIAKAKKDASRREQIKHIGKR